MFTRETATRNARVLLQRAEGVLSNGAKGINPYTIENLVIFGEYATTQSKELSHLDVYIELTPANGRDEYQAQKESVELYLKKNPNKRPNYDATQASMYAKVLIYNTLKGRSRVIRLHGTSEKQLIEREILAGRALLVVRNGQLVSPDYY